MSQKKKKKKQTPVQKKVTKKKSTPFFQDKFMLALGGFIFAIAFLLYANTITHDYALDDNSVITDSHIVRGGAKNIGKVFTTRYRQGSFGNSSTMYRPMSIAMFAVEWNISKNNPSISHFVNVLMFAFTCLLLFLTFKEILGKYSIWIPFLAALLFAIHPVHTEIVANIKSRDEILVLFFGVIALNLLWKYIKEGEQTKHLLWSVLAMTAAMFSKENAVNMVALVPLSLFFFSKLELPKIAGVSVLYFIPVALYIMVRISVLGEMFPPGTEPDLIDNFLANSNASGMEQKATAMWVMGKYLCLLVFPYPLICDYNYNYIPITNFSNPLVFVSVLVHVGLLGYALWSMKSKKFLSYAILFYLGNMALYSNILKTIGAGLGERFLYISSFGFCLAVAYFLAKYLGGGTSREEGPNDLSSMLGNSRIPLLSIVGVIMILASYQTIMRNFDWKDSYTLYAADIEKAPESARLNGYIGTEYLKKGKDEADPKKKKEYFDNAVSVYTKAVSIYPNYTEALGQLGLSYFRKGNYAEAAKYYEKAISDPQCKGSIYSNYGWLYFNDGLTKQQQGNSQGFQLAMNKAKEMYLESLRREPNYADGYMNLGSTFGMLGDHASAVKNFETAIEFAKDEQKPGIYLNLSKAYANLGKNAEAQEAQRKASQYK